MADIKLARVHFRNHGLGFMLPCARIDESLFGSVAFISDPKFVTCEECKLLLNGEKATVTLQMEFGMKMEKARLEKFKKLVTENLNEIFEKLGIVGIRVEWKDAENG